MTKSKPNAKKSTNATLKEQLDKIIEEYKQTSDISPNTLDDLKYLIDEFLEQYSFLDNIEAFERFSEDDEEFDENDLFM